MNIIELYVYLAFSNLFVLVIDKFNSFVTSFNEILRIKNKFNDFFYGENFFINEHTCNLCNFNLEFLNFCDSSLLVCSIKVRNYGFVLRNVEIYYFIINNLSENSSFMVIFQTYEFRRIIFDVLTDIFNFLFLLFRTV